MTDHSDNPTVVQYAVQSLFKGKSIASAAKHAAQKLSGGSNMFIDSSGATVSVDPKSLEEALMTYILANAVEAMKKYKIGAEGATVGGTIRKFRLGKKDAVTFHKKLIAITGPLPGDDVTPEKIVEAIEKWG